MYHGERFNSISHLLGAIAAIAALTLLVVYASLDGDPWKITSGAIYGVTLCLLYITSTLYHSSKGRIKAVLQKLDHFAIYLLIAGTYTPFALVTLRGPWGWSILGVIWGLAILGIVLDALPNKGRRVIPIIIYLLMGWLCLIALNPLLEVLPMAGFWWLLIGGIFYTTGLIFYFYDHRVPHFHGIWHLFVLAGSGAHFGSVFLYVV